MPPQNIVIGQDIDPQKADRARDLRQKMTGAEKILWECLRANRLGGLHFRRQQVIAGYIVDFYCHAAGLAVEVDGSVHEFQAEKDSKRDMVLAAKDIRVLRIPNWEVFEKMEIVLQKIIHACSGSIE